MAAMILLIWYNVAGNEGGESSPTVSKASVVVFQRKRANE